MAGEQKLANTASKPRKRFIGSKSATPSKHGGAPIRFTNQIPEEILTDPLLNQAIQQLPTNYSFEIHKTIHHVRKNNAKMISLQMPEGLQMFACTIADIIERFTDAFTVIMGDVTYGACCIDDYTAVALGCDMLVHYGHSCLVPIDQTSIKTLYIFVEITIDSTHLADTVRMNLPSDRATFYEQFVDLGDSGTEIPTGQKIGKPKHLRIQAPSSMGDFPEHDERPHTPPQEPTRLALVSTIQFASALQKLKENLVLGCESYKPCESQSGGEISRWPGKYDASIPQSKPLSPGEILGCTAPSLNEVDALLYLGDGRFHLESIMISNPGVPAFRYDPYSKKITRECYDYLEMRRIRDLAVQSARESIASLSPLGPTELELTSAATLSGPVQYGQLWGAILGTLGRQGSLKQLQAITNQLATSRIHIPYVPILLSEVSPAKLSLLNPHISVFVQTSCPRLSIDWGYAFAQPLLSPYETIIALGSASRQVYGENGEEKVKTGYSMDFYEAGTPWAISRLTGSF